MNNIFITKNIKRDKEYGSFVHENDIGFYYYNNKADKDFLEDNDPLFLPEPNKIDGKFTYLLVAYSTSTDYGRLINENNICIDYFNTKEEAINTGIKTIKSGIYRDNIKLGGIEDCTEDDIDVLEFKDYTHYCFEIFKILIDRHVFNTSEERDAYYNENLSKIKKEDMYDFLFDMVGGYEINTYTIDGKLSHTTILDDYRSMDVLSLQSLMGYHVTEFNEGDLVKLKNDMIDDVFVILHKYTRSESIYECDDPLHYREGYQLKFRDNDCILNDYWQDLYYDEDLIKIE